MSPLDLALLQAFLFGASLGGVVGFVVCLTWHLGRIRRQRMVGLYVQREDGSHAFYRSSDACVPVGDHVAYIVL